MKKLRNFLRQPRFFLSIAVLPLLMMTAECPPIFTPPPPPAGTCPTVPIILDARKCLVVEPPCTGVFNWQSGDTLSITASQIGNLPIDVFNFLRLDTQDVRSGNTLMRRVCQDPDTSVNAANGRASYQYTFQNGVGEGIYIVSFTNQTALTASIDDDRNDHAVYGNESAPTNFVPRAQAKGGTPPYSYIWTANGVTLPTTPGDSPGVIRHSPTRNTEYRLRVFDQVKRQATAAMVVFITDFVTGNPIPGDPAAAFTISPQTIQTNQPVTLNPSTSTGGITRWDWDFDWRGDIVEPFDRTINGTNGTTIISWNQTGKKYIRLRVTTAAGNFHEIFQRVSVN